MTTTFLARATSKPKSIDEIRQGVVEHLERHGDMDMIGFDDLELMSVPKALGLPIVGTVFQVIAGALTEQGAEPEGGYKTVGDVMRGLGFDDDESAFEAAHWIGCHCHLTPNLATVAGRIEGLSTS